ncbi:MAG: FtsQ-type POTRA domain-containing protein [Alphaproteobacteria bacterium]|nr:FtsQ-type POTRA domain-containing protein [Alphaproteobacteria bacterium]MDE2163945.1 FtsQ-type POTRA domain-containing protein [Alphaproteobacteria bacterium]MDE2266333.1 FtsQ-type POTRA domain-containing protein [Alphaproteobacteria bacterium]MDE2499966.1 FtsQ-type POTRA domain-containing protein [Alphaproteobacteria bacterium]
MRSVRQARKPRDERGKQGRSSARGVTRGAAQQKSFGRRQALHSNLFSRAWNAVRGFLALRRPMLIMTLVIVVLTALAGLFASGVIGRTIHRTEVAYDTLLADAGFGITQVHLSGNVRTPQVTIMAALGFTQGQSIFSVNLPSARARLMQLPWVADAVVKRRYPDDINVRIVEKQPFARWQTPKDSYVVERSGAVITDKGLDQFPRLPLLLGDGAPQKAAPIVAAVAGYRAIAARVYAYQYQSDRRWNLLLDDGVVVKLPETGWQKQLGALEHLIVDKGILERDVVEIDLRSPTQYFFVTKTGEQKDKKTISGRAI